MKILIVDDEMMIKEWLKYTISTLSFEITLLDTASNGIEALEKVKSEQYDLIFIDITMPKMNGIDLLRSLNEQAIHSMLIVLSSHDEFQFAKEAIKYNIKEYVLKNECSKEKLSEILHSCHEKILNQQIHNNLTQEFMERVLNNTIPLKGIDIIKQCFPKIVGKIFFVAASKIDRDEVHGKYENPHFRLKHEGIISEVNDLSFLLFSIESNDSKSNYNYNYSGFLFEEFNKKVSCGKLCRDTSEILLECRNAWIGYQNLFYNSEDYCSGRNPYMDFDTNEVDSLCETAISDIRSYTKEKTISNLHEINSYFSNKRPTDIDSVINIYLSLLNTFIIFNNTNARNVTKKLNMIRQSINGFGDFNQLSDWIIQMFETNIDLVDRSRYSPAVENALEFIELNFKEITNVMEIAEHVNLSLDYFSRLFKKEVGDTLNSYLINFRLDKASIILISSNLSIQEVAQRVGIENGSYFSKCFKKKFNTQPIQFRIQTKQSET